MGLPSNTYTDGGDLGKSATRWRKEGMPNFKWIMAVVFSSSAILLLRFTLRRPKIWLERRKIFIGGVDKVWWLWVETKWMQPNSSAAKAWLHGTVAWLAEPFRPLRQPMAFRDPDVSTKRGVLGCVFRSNKLILHFEWPGVFPLQNTRAIIGKRGRMGDSSIWSIQEFEVYNFLLYSKIYKGII